MQVLSHPGFILSIGDMSNDVRRVIELHGFDEKGSFGILADIGSKSVDLYPINRSIPFRAQVSIGTSGSIKP
jgi:hypothetical protein